MIVRYGVVSSEVASAMAIGALERSHAGVAVAITGFAGPAGKHDQVGLVHVFAASRNGKSWHRECHFGDRDRDGIRLLAAQAALEILISALE